MSGEGSSDPTVKKYRWEDDDGGHHSASSLPSTTRWSTATPRQYGGGETPRMAGGGEHATWRGMSTPSLAGGGATPHMGYSGDTTVVTPRFGPGGGATPSNNGIGGGAGNATPFFGGAGGATPMMTGAGGATPAAGFAFAPTPNYQLENATPVQSHFAATESATTAAVEAVAKKLEKEWRLKNKRLTAEYLDSILPTEYFTIVPVPPDYNPVPSEPNFYELARDSLDLFPVVSAEAEAGQQPVTYDIPESLGDGMPAMKPEDAPVFVELLKYHNVDPIPDEHLPAYLLMKNLFKIKNGDTMQRRQATRYLLDKSRVLGSNLIFKRMFRIWNAKILDIAEKHYFMDFTKSLISHLGREVRSSAKEIVDGMKPMLTAREGITRGDAKQVLILLARVVGFQGVFDAIKEDFAHEESAERRRTATVAAIIGYASGTTEELMEALSDMSLSPVVFARQTVAIALGDLAGMVRHAIIGALPDIVPILSRLIRDEKRVRRDAANAVARIAEASAPSGIDELAPLVDVICDECRRGIGSTSGPFLSAFGALVPLMAPYDARTRTTAMMPTLVNQFNTPEDEHRRILLSVVRKCVSADGITASFIREVITEPFFDGFWSVRRVAADRKTASTLIATTVEMARKLGGSEVLLRLVGDMKDENELYQRLVIDTVRRVVLAVGTDALADALVAALLDGAIAAVNQDVMGTNRVVMDGLAAIVNCLGTRLKPYMKDVFDLINRRRINVVELVRAQAADLAARTVHAVMIADGLLFLQDLSRSLYERMEDDSAIALSANLKATRACLAELGARHYKPSVRELLKKLTFVIKNRSSNVQQNTIALIEDIATNYEADVDAIHLHELATKGLFELLDAERRETRRACTRTFGVIAKTIRPFAIILELVDNFRQDKRKIRICTAVALGAIAKACGPFTVIPYLLNEYKISEGEQVAVIVQHSVLKALRYMFEFIGQVGKEYVYPLIPLLERALTETSLTMRRMAVEACRAIIMAVAGNDGFEEVTVHLLSFIHPNIVELLSKNESKIADERLKMVTAVVGYYEAARLVLGSGKILEYLLQGLFHPARKVRDIYRRTYNMIYVASPDCLVPFYPCIEDSSEHTYTRHVLEVIV